jgi:hypothetical protein
MIRSLALAILLLSAAGAAAMRLNPLAVSEMIDDRRPAAVMHHTGIPAPPVRGLKPWPTEIAVTDDWGKGAPNLLTHRAAFGI